MSIASRLKEARMLRGYTQDSLASAIGMSRGVILNIESEKNGPALPVTHAICKVLQINEQWLITGEGEMSPSPESIQLLSEIYDLAKELSVAEQDYILDMIKTFQKHREQIINKKDM